MLLSNTPSHNLLKQQAGERGLQSAPRLRVGLPNCRQKVVHPKIDSLSAKRCSATFTMLTGPQSFHQWCYTKTADKSSRHAPPCRSQSCFCQDSRWTAHGMCLLLCGRHMECAYYFEFCRLCLYFSCFHLWNFKLPRHFAIS